MVRRLCAPRAGQAGFYAHRRSAADFTFVGDCLLFSNTSHLSDRPYAHAVALRGDMGFDSEASSPVVLVDRELPSNFGPWTDYAFDMQPPPAAVPEEVDLTLDSK